MMVTVFCEIYPKHTVSLKISGFMSIDYLGVPKYLFHLDFYIYFLQEWVNGY